MGMLYLIRRLLQISFKIFESILYRVVPIIITTYAQYMDIPTYLVIYIKS